MSKNRSAVLKDDVFQIDLEILITGCLFWDAVNNLWSNKGCRVRPDEICLSNFFFKLQFSLCMLSSYI